MERAERRGESLGARLEAREVGRVLGLDLHVERLARSERPRHPALERERPLVDRRLQGRLDEERPSETADPCPVVVLARPHEDARAPLEAHRDAPRVEERRERRDLGARDRGPERRARAECGHRGEATKGRSRLRCRSVTGGRGS